MALSQELAHVKHHGGLSCKRHFPPLAMALSISWPFMFPVLALGAPDSSRWHKIRTPSPTEPELPVSSAPVLVPAECLPRHLQHHKACCLLLCSLSPLSPSRKEGKYSPQRGLCAGQWDSVWARPHWSPGCLPGPPGTRPVSLTSPCSTPETLSSCDRGLCPASRGRRHLSQYPPC